MHEFSGESEGLVTFGEVQPALVVGVVGALIHGESHVAQRRIVWHGIWSSDIAILSNASGFYHLTVGD